MLRCMVAKLLAMQHRSVNGFRSGSYIRAASGKREWPLRAALRAVLRVPILSDERRRAQGVALPALDVSRETIYNTAHTVKVEAHARQNQKPEANGEKTPKKDNKDKCVL